MKSETIPNRTPYFWLLHRNTVSKAPNVLASTLGLLFIFTEGVCWAQSPVCIPGTPFCAGVNGNGGVQTTGSAQGRVSPTGATGYANANANANASTNGNINASGNGQRNTNQNTSGYYAEPTRFGAGILLCGTLKTGIFSGIKAGPCFAVSFRTERLTFELESQLLFGGVRHSVDWVFPMSFVIPLTNQRSLYEGLQLRIGGSPIGATFARERNGGNFIRFGLHTGLSYELGINSALSWRLFDVRTYLDFGTRRQVDLRDHFLDFGGQLATGLVF